GAAGRGGRWPLGAVPVRADHPGRRRPPGRPRPRGGPGRPVAADRAAGGGGRGGRGRRHRRRRRAVLRHRRGERRRHLHGRGRAAVAAGRPPPPRPPANLIGAAVLAGSYLIRMAADSDPGLAWLRWASPLGWIEELRPLTGSQPNALALLSARV